MENTNTNLLRPLYHLSAELKAQAFDALVSLSEGATLTDMNIDPTVQLAVELILNGMEASIDSLIEAKAHEKYLSRIRSEAGKKGAQKTREAKKSAKKTTPTKSSSQNETVSNKENLHILNNPTPKRSKKRTSNVVPITTSKEANLNFAKVNESLYQDIFTFFEENTPNLNHSLSQPRWDNKMKQKLESVLSQYSTDELKELFIIANSNDFLSGHGPNQWIANFSWILDIDHLDKIKSGYYKCCKSTQPSTDSKKNSFNNFVPRSYDFANLERNLLAN